MGWEGKWKGCSGWGTHVHPWLIHVNVWQKPLQYCKVISLQLKKKKKKVLLLRDPLTGQCSLSSKGPPGHSVSQKIRHVFLNSGDQSCPSLFVKIHFKGVILELLAPICKREKRSIHSHGFFLPEASLPALDGGVDRPSTEAFLPWLDLVCPLPTQASYSSLLILPLR